MMNGFSSGHYLPVIVAPDSTQALLMSIEEALPQIHRAYGEVALSMKMNYQEKLDHFTNDKAYPDISGPLMGLKSVQCPEELLVSASDYREWLSDKAVLKTERFYHGYPCWNASSSRHALIGDFQLKGIGRTGALGRFDYNHSWGGLVLYQAILEAVHSWYFSLTPNGSQKVLMIWKKPNRISTLAQGVLLREASSIRLAQFTGTDIGSSEMDSILKSLKCDSTGLHRVYEKSLRDYAWLFCHSIEVASPSSDNLCLDGSLIDCSSVHHHVAPGEWNLPLRFYKTDKGLKASIGFGDSIMATTKRVAKAFMKLGLPVSTENALEIFWSEVALHHPAQEQQVRKLCVDLYPWFESKREMTWDEWKQHILLFCPDALLEEVPPYPSRFLPKSDKDLVAYSLHFKKSAFPRKDPQELVDKIWVMLNLVKEGLDPKIFGHNLKESSLLMAKENFLLAKLPKSQD